MRGTLERRLDEMDGWRGAFVDALSGLSPERLAYRPRGAGWCALDVVQHLVLVEEGVAGYARKKLRTPPGPVSAVDRAKLGLLLAALRSSLRFRAPVPQIVPASTLPLDELAPRWERARAELRETIAALPDDRLRTMLFRHPIAGPLDPKGTLAFLDEHARHHDAQVRRLRRAPLAPA